MTPARHEETALERALGDAVRARLPHRAAELVLFVLKQGWACLFGALLLGLILLTHAIWDDGWPVARYDALLGVALAIQIAFLRYGLETWDEARVIVLFHITGTAMEVFKVQAGSWSYPEPGLFKLMGVPLFSGFMYASVGSYMARAIRIFDMRFAPYPPFWVTVCLATAIYANFFTHHVLPDLRYLLMAATVAVFARTSIGFRVGGRYRMPLIVAAGLSSLALYVAENIGTVTGTWIYAGEVAGWASPAKLGSWYLLQFVAFVTVTLVYRAPLKEAR